MSAPEIDAVRLLLRPVGRAEACELLAGERPAGVHLADDYPSRFSLEVMDLLAGERAGDTEGFAPYFIVRKSDGTVVGEIGGSTPVSPGTVQIGYSIVESAWNRGYATEALRALLDDLLARPGVRQVVADTMVDHTASRRVMEKAGMRLRGTRLDEVDGVLAELVTYGRSAPPSAPAPAAGAVTAS